jgi:hypothetical protein
MFGCGASNEMIVYRGHGKDKLGSKRECPKSL